MKNGKINMLVLILIIVIVLVLGIGVGYCVGANIEKNKIETIEGENTEKLGEISIDSPKNEQGEINSSVNVENTTNVVNEEIKYDGEKKITIDGKVYTVSYVNTLEQKNEYYKELKVTLYLNNNKICTVGPLPGDDNILLGTDEELTLKTIQSNDTLLIVAIVNSIRDNGINEPVEYTNLCIFDLKGDLLGDYRRNNATQIYERNTGNSLTYSIEDNKIIWYETCNVDDKYWVAKYEITYNGYDTSKFLVKLYTEEEVSLAGK